MGPQLISLSIQSTRALIIVCHALALPTTVFRLLHKVIEQKLWWDDFWAAMAFASDIMLFVVYLSSPTGFPKPKNAAQYAARWLTIMCYTTTLWAARLTVAVTIIRLMPKGPERRLSIGAAIVFFLFMLSMVLQKAIACAPKGPSCLKLKYPGYMEITMAIIADLWLVFGPAYMLWQTNLQRSHHRLLLAIFLCSIFTTLASIAHVVFIFVGSPAWLGITGHIEVAIAIIVSNLLVVITYVYRVFRNISSSTKNGLPIPKQQQQQNSPRSNRDGRENESNENPTAQTVPSHLDEFSSGSQSEFSDVSEMSAAGVEDSNGNYSSSRNRTTTVELTDLSHFTSSAGISTAPVLPSIGSSDATGPTPFSSFSYPTTDNGIPSSQARSG